MVYEAVLDGKRVAVKKPILSTSEDLDKFHKQLQLLCKLNHPGTAKLIAAHARPPNYMFFFQLYECGNLAEKLHVDEWSPSINQALHIAIRLAKVLQYLHKLGIVHRDVKPANILLDQNFNPHLADFGLAEYVRDLKQVSSDSWQSSGKPTGGFHKKNMVGTLIYMAPEILKKNTQTAKSDVYSFGVLFNEILTGVIPYTDLRAEAQAHTVLEMNYTEQQLTAAVVSDGLRPALASLKSGVPARILSLIGRCWDGNPQNRPSFDEIVLELNVVLQQTNGMEEGVISPLLYPIASENIDATSTRAYQENVSWLSVGEASSKEASLASSTNVRILFDSSTHASAYSPIVSCGSFATCGRRETMEDRHFLMPRAWNEKDVHIFGIFDGHRGAAAAEFSAGALPGFLQAFCSTSSDPSTALVEAFIKTDGAFRKEFRSQCKSKAVLQKDCHPGCTAIAALIAKDRLFVANAGDCRAILCRAGHPYALSRDHTASCPGERDRVISAGAEVQWQLDTWRVGQAALQVTRSIGDDDLKPAVTAEPEITETILCAEDEYIVMASDGLWDVMSNTEVIGIIKDTVKEAGMCSKRLATEAAGRGSKDNITVIVVFLRPVSTAERVY